MSVGVAVATGLATIIACNDNNSNNSQKDESHIEEVSSKKSAGYIFNNMIMFDDQYPETKAFAEYGGKKVELKKNWNGVCFVLPDSLGNTNDIVVYSVDKGGKKSPLKRFYVLEGILSENPFPSENIFPPSNPRIVDYSIAAHNVLFFDDDNAVGMKAFARYDGKEYELKPVVRELNRAGFDVPKELYDKTGEILVFAVDRKGKKSKPELFYLSDKVIHRNP
ncbi:hypothetical protein KY345_01785 [Candidatus Woesearchaeota archaeon]|nr:hypothetical protein [Candidatus Woesearchaeota archaeon]